MDYDDDDDVVVRRLEVCPNCYNSGLSFEPAYTDGEITGTLVNCVECSWYRVFEEDNPGDAEALHEKVTCEWVLMESLPDNLQERVEEAIQDERPC